MLEDITILPKGSNIQHLPQRSQKKPWYARVYLGQGEYLKQGFVTKDEAETWVKLQSDQIAQTLPVKVTRPPKLKHKIKDGIHLWHTNHTTGVTYNTKIDYLEIINREIIPNFGDMYVEDINISHILDYIYAQRKVVTSRGTLIKDKTIINKLTPLSGYLDDQIRRSIIEKNPIELARKIAFFGRKNQESAIRDKALKEKIFTLTEVETLLATAKNYGGNDNKLGLPSPWDKGEIYFPIALAVSTGLRIGELCNLRRGSIIYQDILGRPLLKCRVLVKEIKLRRKDPHGEYIIQKHTKGKEEREIPLNDKLQEIMKEYDAFAIQKGYGMKPDDPLFPITSNYGSFEKMYRRVGAKAGFPIHKQGIHCCRHITTTYLVANKVPLTTVAKITGHKDLRTLLRYVHLVGLDYDDATNCLGDLLKEETPNLRIPPNSAPKLDENMSNVFPINFSRRSSRASSL